LTSYFTPCIDSICYPRYRLQKFIRSPEALYRIFLKQFLKENYDRLWNVSESLKRYGGVLMLIHHVSGRTLE